MEMQVTAVPLTAVSLLAKQELQFTAVLLAGVQWEQSTTREVPKSVVQFKEEALKVKVEALKVEALKAELLKML